VNQGSLVSALNDLISLLQACGESDQAAWAEERKSRAAAAANGGALDAVKKEVRDVLAGMGSLSDLYLVPKPGSGLTKEEARRKQFELVDRLDELTAP
jgi:hypothetical protein